MSDEKKEAVDISTGTKKKETAPITAASNKPAFAAKKADRLIYLGPSVVEEDESGGCTFMLKTGTIYSNGLPEDVAERVKSDSQLAKLFITVKNIASAIRRLRDENSDLSAAVKQIIKTYLSRKAMKAR